MRRAVIAGANVQSVEEIIQSIYVQLLPDPSDRHYIQDNMDALNDVLTTMVEEPWEVIWRDADLSRKTVGDVAFGRLCGTLAYASAFYDDSENRVELR